MDINNMFGKQFKCECDKTHKVPNYEMVYKEEAIKDIPKILKQYTSGKIVNLVADKRTYEVAGKTAEDVLISNGFVVIITIVPDNDHGIPVCDDITKEELLRILKPCDIFLAVGSGVVSDLVKWVSFELNTPYVMLATAASMNGYSSKNIAPAIKGVKCLIMGTTPCAIVAEPSVIENAPAELTASGMGDVLAKQVSMPDWMLNHIIFDEYYCPLCSQLIKDFEPKYLHNPEKIKAKDPEAIKALFLALVYSGISMTIAGTSSPASGGEHLVSHALDMTSSIYNIPHDYHGRQVGLGTIFTSALYEHVLALESPEFKFVSEETDKDYWKDLTGVVEEQHAKKRAKAKSAVERLKEPGMWKTVRETLKPMTLKAKDVKECLSKAGAAHTIEDIGCNKERFLKAVLHCHQMRERYTIIDLARAIGVLPEAAEEIIDEYLI